MCIGVDANAARGQRDGGRAGELVPGRLGRASRPSGEEHPPSRHIELDVNASGNNFLFLGDTFMSGDAEYKLFKISTGWDSFIDGEETKIYKTNHGFRGVVVPKGKHKVVFTYLPQSFVISKYLSLILSSLVIFGLVVGILFTLKKKKAKTEEQIEA